MQCSSMDKNVDQCSAVECTAAPRLTKPPKEETNPCMFLSVLMPLSALFERFGVSRMGDFFVHHRHVGCLCTQWVLQ